MFFLFLTKFPLLFDIISVGGEVPSGTTVKESRTDYRLVH